MNNDFEHLRFLRDRQRAEVYVNSISEQLKETKFRFLKTAPISDVYRDALILFCIENNYEYDSSSWIFTIDKGK
jgi:hypothetical protein